MGTVIDMLFLVGVLASLVKGGDLFLRESQKKKVQEISETATLWLEALHPIDWFRTLTTPRNHVWLLLFGVLEVVIVIVFIFSMHGFVPLPEFGFLEFLVQLTALLLSVLSFPLIVRRYGPRTMAWLFSDSRSFWFILRYLKLIAVGYAIGIFCLLLLVTLIWLVGGAGPFFGSFDRMFQPNTVERSIYLAVALLLWPALTYFWIVTQVGALILCLLLVIGTLEVLLRMLRGLAWRIVEYSRGA